MEQIKLFIDAAMTFGISYIFVDKGMITDDTISVLKKCGYSVVVGQGEIARVKISW